MTHDGCLYPVLTPAVLRRAQNLERVFFRNLLLNICDDALLQRLDSLLVDHLRHPISAMSVSSRGFFRPSTGFADPRILRDVPLPPLPIQRGPSRWTSLGHTLPTVAPQSCDRDHVVESFALLRDDCYGWPSEVGGIDGRS